MQEPRIVFLDLETIPNLRAALEHWTELSSQRPGRKPTMSATVTSICSFGYRVLGEKKAQGVNAWDFPNWERDVNDDSEICKRAGEILANADAIVTFNGKGFDGPFLQTRMKANGLDWLPKVTHIDLCRIVRSNLLLLNNRLKTVAKYLLDDSKMEHEGWPLWVKTHGSIPRVRDVKAEAKMGKYNLKDVDLMVPIFKELRPMIQNIPNHNLFDVGQGIKPVCPKCGSTRLISQGIRPTQAVVYRRYNCKDCGSPLKATLTSKIIKPL